MTDTGTHEITISRVFDAPPELVYRAFVEPDQLSEWFGPVGFSVPPETVSVDARPGGFWRLIMVSDEDETMRSPIDGDITEIVENELLVAHQDVEGIPGTSGHLRFHLRLEFHPEPGGKTRLELRQGPFNDQMGKDTVTGWESSFTKLDSLLRQSL